MNSKNYFSWFIKLGWKNYGLAFLITVLVNLAVFINFNSLIEESNSLLMTILITLVIVVATLAITYHSYQDFKFWKEKLKE